ncbi:MAG: formate dehydrogenase accessory sulfurtransferase FdhD [Lachnospiraceae bacterium]|nr:formate dehydrogenase accessory sulfurtransferase FdhD [Lachnospiraceae bacterium]
MSGQEKYSGQDHKAQDGIVQAQDLQWNNLHWKKEWIFGIANAFAQDSALHKSTGGTHSCMLAVEDRILYKAEDIGRHNALDKAIGYAVREQLNRSECILFTTGRVPTDMVRKAAAAGIPLLVSKAVPTADAVDMARGNGITLICRAWPDSFEIYA